LVRFDTNETLSCIAQEDIDRTMLRAHPERLRHRVCASCIFEMHNAFLRCAKHRTEWRRDRQVSPMSR
jgi:hypothetical protein